MVMELPSPEFRWMMPVCLMHYIFRNKMKEIVEAAKKIALDYHDGMTDKYDYPYFDLERVADRVREMELIWSMKQARFPCCRCGLFARCH